MASLPLFSEAAVQPLSAIPSFVMKGIWHSGPGDNKGQPI